MLHILGARRCPPACHAQCRRSDPSALHVVQRQRLHCRSALSCGNGESLPHMKSLSLSPFYTLSTSHFLQSPAFFAKHENLQNRFF
jgi:hypothetical protein